MVSLRNLRVRYIVAGVILTCLAFFFLQWREESAALAKPVRKPGIRSHDLPIFTNNAINNTVVVVPVNSGMMYLTDNLLCSLKQTDFNTSRIIFWALDDGAADTLRARGHVTYRDPTLWGTASDQNTHGNTPDYQRMMRQRPIFYIDVLTSGFDLLMLDVDISFWRSPLDVVPSESDKEHVSVVYTTDAREFYEDHNAFDDDFRRGSLMPPVCNGMFWMKATKDTVAIWTEMLRIFEAPWWRMGLFRLMYFQDDQRGVDVLLNDGRAELVGPFPTGITADMVPNPNSPSAPLKVRLVDQAAAVSGHLMLQKPDSYSRYLADLRKTGNERIMAHMNWDTALISKLDGAKKFGLYFLDNDGKCTKHSK